MAIDVRIACGGEDVPGDDEIRAWVTAAIDGADGDRDADVSVCVVDEAAMRSLNVKFRQQDRVTNVLSFPAGEIEGLPNSEPAVLGDIVVCAPVVAAEAKRQQKAPGAHWGHLLVHGTLHLLGFDHLSEDEAAEMERLESRILSERGVTDPYRIS